MKKAAAFLLFAFLASVSGRAAILFQDDFNYPDGSIETDGLWQVYSPAPPNPPYGDAFVSNNMLILNDNNHDAVTAPFTNTTGSTVIFASFTIDVTSLPSTSGGFFAQFQDTNSDYVGHVFINTEGTTVPGTYRLGTDNYSTSSASGTNYPLDLATNTVYYVVVSYDTNQNSSYPGATLVVNPASIDDYETSPAYGRDNTPSAGQSAPVISGFDFSQYANQGIIEIGDVIIGTTFSDVFPYTVTAPVFGIQPQPTGAYSGNNVQLYSAVSALGQLSEDAGVATTYQWYSNNVALVDDGVTVIGSTSNILTLNNVQTTADFDVVASDTAGTNASLTVTVTVTNTPTVPFFTNQPYGVTNGLGGTIKLSAGAEGTGPITYAWYFEETNTSSFVQVATGPVLTLANANFAQSGLYYATATGGAGFSNSVTVSVQIIPPPPVTIAYLKSLLATNNVVNGPVNLNGGEIYTVQGVVTSFGIVESTNYSEFFVQDATGGALAFINPGKTNTPAVGSAITLTALAQEYYGQLEIAPNTQSSNNTTTVVSTNNPLPAPVLLNLPSLATNTMGTYGVSVQGDLVTLTNVYLYGSKTGGSLAGTNFPTNGTKTLYIFQQPYAANLPHLTLFLTTYINAANQVNTNFWGKPIPSFCYQLTGAIDIYATNNPEFIPSRYQDFVSVQPTNFPIALSYSNDVSTVTWPAVPGQTYSVYSSSNVNGPFTQTFGLSYYPSTGSYTVTNTASNQFFWVSTP